MPSEYLRQRDPCPLEKEGTRSVIYAVGIDYDEGAYIRVCENVCENVCKDCRYKIMLSHNKDGTITVRCNAPLRLEGDK